MSSIRVTPIFFGQFALDGGAMFGIVPKALWSRRSAVDEKNRIPLGLRSLLIEGNGFKALVDAGMGSKWDPKSEERYLYQNQSYEEALEKNLGFKTSEITHVLVTHLHFDHVGGLTRWNPGTKKLESVFSNAEILVHERNLKRAETASLREKASYRAENWQLLKDNGQIRTFRGENGSLLAGINFETSYGHTEGQALYHVAASDAHYVFCGDLIPTQAHLEPVWGMGYDTEPLTMTEEKSRFLLEASRNNWRLAFSHDPKVPWLRSAFDAKAKNYYWLDEG